MFVFDVEEKLHYIDIDFQGLGGLLVIVGFLVIRFLSWGSGLLARRWWLSRRLLSRGLLGSRLLGRGKSGGQQQCSQCHEGQKSALRKEKVRHPGLSRDSWLVLV